MDERMNTWSKSDSGIQLSLVNTWLSVDMGSSES